MSGRYQLIAGTKWGIADDFATLREKARTEYLLQPQMWLVRDTTTGALYDISLDDVTEPDSRRADLIDHAKDTLLWPYRGASDE